MKILTVIGARPQFIKAAAVSRLLPPQTEVLVHTGQHYDDNMSAVFFSELGIPSPSYHLGIGSGSHGAQTGRMLEKIEAVVVAERPDIVLVYGDTNSTLAGALVAAKLHIPIAHVEAGLRSFNRNMPEEINRVLTDHVADWLFAPTPTAVANATREGIAPERIHLVGDVMYDVALLFRDRGQPPERWGLRSENYVLATIHRAENTDDPVRLQAIFGAFQALARSRPVVLPLHPRTRAALKQQAISCDGLQVIDPVGYFDMTALERHAKIIVTDSGGVQKEAYFQRVPCVTLRDETEWVELVDIGWNTLVPPTNSIDIVNGIERVLNGPSLRRPEVDLFGGGEAAQTIARLLLRAT